MVFAGPFSSLPWRDLEQLGESNPSLSNLIPKLKQLVIEDRSSSTRKSYLGGFRRWCKWAQEHKVSTLPADGRHVALFLCDIAQQSRTSSPILSATYGVSWAHRKALLSDPTKHSLVVQVCQSCKRVCSHPTRKKKALTVHNVMKVVEMFGVPGTSLRNLQGVLIVVLGFFGFLRWNDLSLIKVEGISIHRHYMSVFLRKRKNDQFHKGNFVYLSRMESAVCPVTIVERFLLRCDISSGPLLRKVETRGSKEFVSTQQLSYAAARKLVLEMLAATGLNSREYGLHSLRAGGASHAANLGISDRRIACHGGWKSYQSCNRYIRDDRRTLLSVSKELCI